MLTFNVKRVWFDKIRRGEKSAEFRIVKDYWTQRLIKAIYGVTPKDEIYEKSKHRFYTCGLHIRVKY